MSRLRSAFTLGAIFTILAGVCAPRASAVVFNTDLTTVPGPGGIVSLNFTVSNTAAGALSVDVYRISSSVMPVIGAFTAGTLIGSNIPVNDGAPTTLVNTGLEATNVANGFNAGTTTVSAGEYWYLVRAKEVGIGGDVPSSIQGAVADANPPSTMGINQFTLTCSDGTGNVDVAFVNPNDEVGDSGSNPVLHPVRQFASPSANYRFDFILYRVAQSEAFDLTSDPVPGNIVTTQEIFPYDRDNSTTYTDPAPAGTALAYGIRIQDTVGNQSGGSPLSSNQRASAVTPPDDVAAAQLLLAGVPVNCVSFTMNTLSLVSDPGDVTPAVVRVYARDDGALIDSSNLGSSFLIDSINYASGTSNDTIIYYHTPSNPTLPRLNNVTYTYGIVLVTDNNRTSCVSNSVSLLTTDILPPDLIELATPADGSKVNGTVIFSATVSDDSPAGGGIQTVTFELNGNTIGVASNVTVGPGTGTAQVSFDTTTLPDGLYTYSATAADYNGNSLETGSGDPGAGPDFTIRIDNTPATVTVDSPTKNTPVNVQFALSGTAVDANATIVSVTVNYSTSTGSGFVLASGTSAWTGVVPVDPLFADDDILYVTVEALDDCGLVGVATSCFCVDNLCPIAFISAPSVFGPGGGAFIVSADDDDFLGACNAGINQVTLTALLNGATEVYTSGPPPALGGIHILPILDFNLNHGETSIITIEARDGAVDVGNECFGASATVTADYEPPICSLISPASGDVVTAISIIGQATDVGAAGVLESCVEVVGVTTICGVTQVTGLVNPGADGLYTLIMSSTDTVGNATVCDSVVVRVDTVPPVVDITSPLPPNVGVNVSFLLSGTASDLGSGVQAVTVEYTTDSGTSVVVATVDNPGAFNVNWSAVIPVDPLLSDDEIFSVTAYAVDAANLQGSDTENYFVDDTSSCAVLGFPTAGSSVFVGAAGLVLSATLGDDDASSSFDTGVTAANATALLTGATDVLFTSDPPALGSTPINSPFDPAAYGLGDGDVSDINVCLVDGATGTANICCVTFEVIVDLTAPTCSIDAPEDGVCFSFDNTVLGATDITISATDLGSGLAAIGYRILNSLNAVVASATVGVSGTSATFTFSENVVGLGDGTYTLISQATDEVGNGGQCDQITFTVRTTGPLTTINNPFRAIVNDNLSVNGFSTVPTFSSGSSGLPGPGTPAGQSALTPGDDDSVEINFSGSFAFPFFGVLYDSVWVNSNGNLTFQNGDPDPTESVAEFTNGVPRIAPFWDDFNPAAAGSITSEQQADRLIIRWINVPQFGIMDQNTFRVTLYSTGAILFEYEGMNSTDGLAGVAPGFGGPVSAVDISAASPVTMSATGSYEIFTTLGNPADLDNLSIAFLPQNDLVGTSGATSVLIGYPGPNGDVLPPLPPAVEAAVAPVSVGFNPLGGPDQGIEIAFTNGFEFPFFGKCWNSVVVSNHGFLEFGQNTTAALSVFAPTPANVNGPTPKVMGFFADIGGHLGGGTFYRQFDDRFQVIYDSVPETLGAPGNINDITITLYNTGAVQFEYGTITYFSTAADTNVGIGVAGGVSGQPVDGYESIPLVTNGVLRNPIDISGLPGAATQFAVLDKVQYEVFNATNVLDVTPVIGFQGSTIFTAPGSFNPITGAWSANLVISPTFCSDGDPFSVCALGFGGCTANTRGAATNKVYVLDVTDPTVTMNVDVTPGGCSDLTLELDGILSDVGVPGWRIDSGICDLELEVWQGGVQVATIGPEDIYVGVMPLSDILPWGPDDGPLFYNATVSNVTLNVVSLVPFGLNMVVRDCARDVANVTETYPGAVPEIYVLDPTVPECALLAPSDGACISYANTVLGATDIIITTTDTGGCPGQVGYEVRNLGGGVVASGTSAVSAMVETVAFSVNFAALGDGVYDIIAFATDQVGNGTQCDAIQVTVDLNGPPVQIADHDEAIVNGDVDITGLAGSVIYATGAAAVPGSLGAFISTSALSLSDDTFTQVNLPFNFPFYSGTYSDMYVGSNGYITFGGGDADFTESPVEFEDGLPRIALFWDDLNPGAGGTVSVDLYSGAAVVRYDSVPEFPNTGANSATATLYVNGAIVIEYGNLTLTGFLVGVSPGGGAPAIQPDINTGGPFDMVFNGLFEAYSVVHDLTDETVVFLRADGVTPADSVDLWYPGPGGNVLPPLDATTEAAVSPVDVFDPMVHNASSIVEVPFSNGFEFPFFGRCWNSVFISARGLVEFGTGTISTGIPTQALVNAVTPKIMGLWSRIDGSGASGGTTTYRQYDDRFIIDYDTVPDDSTLGTNTISITLYNTGAVGLEYVSTNAVTYFDCAVGINSGVVGQDISGYGDVPGGVQTNGLERAQTNLSGLPGAPTQASVSDQSHWEIFNDTFDIGPSFAFQGTSIQVVGLPLDASGAWAYNVPISATFCGDGDPFGVSAKAFGGCNGITRGPSDNRLYAIDRTDPAVALFNVVDPFSFTSYVGECFHGLFGVLFTANDAGLMGYRIDSGICTYAASIYQNGALIGSVTGTLPDRPNQGGILLASLVDPVAIGLQPGWFGIDVSAGDCGINVANVNSQFGGSPPETFYYDPLEPKSQPICSRLFIAAVTEIASVSRTILYEIDPDHSDLLNTEVVGSLMLPAEISSATGCALGYDNDRLYYGDTNSASGANTIFVYDVSVPGSIVLTATLTLPASVTVVAGMGAEGGRLYINEQASDDQLYVLDAATGAYLGAQPAFFPLPGAELEVVAVGSGAFGRTFFAERFDPAGAPPPRDRFFESFPGGTNFITPGLPSFRTVGMGFSGTRLFHGRIEPMGNVIREVATTFEQAAFNAGFELNTFFIPDGATVCAVAAAPALYDCTICLNDLPYKLAAAVTDTAPCPMSRVDLFAYDVEVGPASAVLVNTATDITTGLVRRGLLTFPDASVLPTSAAIACATITEATLRQILPDGEGQIRVISQAYDGAVPTPNVESATGMLIRGITFTVDIRAPRVPYLASLPFAATSGSAATVDLTVRFEDFGTGLNVTTDPPTLTGLFSVLGGSATDATFTLSLAPAVNGVVTGTASFAPANLTLPATGSAYIDFVVSATDNCANATTVVLLDRFIIDNQTPLADDPDPYYPAEDIIANGTGGGLLWSYTNPLVWTGNEMFNMDAWDEAFNTAFPGTLAELPNILGGTLAFPVIPQATSCDEFNPGIEPDIDFSPSGVASVELYYATGPADATPALLAFSNFIDVATEVVEVTGGGYIPLSKASALRCATGTFVWDVSSLPATTPGSDDYFYLKTITRDHAGNSLDPVFGPLINLDVIPPTRTIITAQALFGTPDVRLDWEYIPIDNVGTIGYEIYRTRTTVDDVLDANPFTDFDLIGVICAYDGNGQPITEFLDTSVPPEGTYAYFIVAFDQAGNGWSGNSLATNDACEPFAVGLAGNISNIVAAAPNDLVDPYPVTNLRVRAGEPDDGILLSWDIPSVPVGGGPVRPTGDNIAISVWEIFRDQRSGPIAESEVSEPDGDIVRDPDLLIGTVVNIILPDMTTPTGTLRPQPTQVVAEKASISAATPNLLVLFMDPLNVGSVSRVFNKTTGESYQVLAATGETIDITGTVLPAPTDVVLVDYLTDNRTFVDHTALPGHSYSYAVVSRDAAGNRSLISTSVLVGDATAVAFDTTPPEPIETLQAHPDPFSEDIGLFWDTTPYDQVGVTGYDIYRRLGGDPIEFLSHFDNEKISEALCPVICFAPNAATVTLTLATSAIDVDLLKVIDTTRNRLIPSATESVDPVNLPNYSLLGDQLTIRNIDESPVAWAPGATIFNNIKVVAFKAATSLYNGGGFDPQTFFLDNDTIGGAPYSYVVLGVDPWGNVADLSNNGFAVANDFTPPATPTVTVDSNCFHEDDYVIVRPDPNDPDVVQAWAFADPGLTDLIGSELDFVGNGFFQVPIGANLYEDVWVVVTDFSGNTSPSVNVVNDIVPPAPLTSAEVTILSNPPGTDDILIAKPSDPDAVTVVVYRDDSLFNVVDSVEDIDDGAADGCWTLNLGDNLSSTFYVTVADAACNESDDLAIGNDTAPPGEPQVTVHNNTIGSGCTRVPVDDTLTAWVSADTSLVKVYEDVALTSLIALVPVTGPGVGPAGSLVGPIYIGDNNSFTPGSLDTVYVIACDAAGNSSGAAHAHIDITAPLITELSIFEQFPQEPGTFPRVEDEVDVQIDIDSAEVDEVVCVKVFTESPTLNRESPGTLTTAPNFNLHGLAADATSSVYFSNWDGVAMGADDVIYRLDQFGTFNTVHTGLVEPTGLAVSNLGQGNLWVASRNPGSPSQVRLTEMTTTGLVLQDIDFAIPAPVAGMTFGATDVLYFITESGAQVFAYDTALATLTPLLAGITEQGRGLAFDGVSTLYISLLATPGNPFSGQVFSFDLTTSTLNLVLVNLAEPAGLALDRRGGLHFGETGLDFLGERIVPQRVSELRPGTDGALVLAQASLLEPAATMVGPVIDTYGRLVTASVENGTILMYQANRRSSVLVDTGVGVQIPPTARILAQRVPGDDFRIEGVRIGDNKVQEVLACAVDKAGNTSNVIASAINDVVGPQFLAVAVVQNPPGVEDTVYGFTDPFTVVRAYADAYLNNRIDREDNAIRTDRLGFFYDLRVGDNQNPFVVLASEDEAGNLSFPFGLFNDIFAPDAPVGDLVEVLSACPGSDDQVVGLPGAVEPNCTVEIYSDFDLTQLVATTVADASGAFGPVSIGDDLYEVLWIACSDAAFNFGPPLVLDGENGRSVNDLVPPPPVDLQNVVLHQLGTGEDLIEGLPGAVDPEDTARVRLFADPDLLLEVGGGYSPIELANATGGWSASTLGFNFQVGANLAGFERMYLVAEDSACNRSTAVSLTFDISIVTPDAERILFNADNPNHNTIRGIEGAVPSNCTIQFSTSVLDFTNSILGTPLLGVAFSDGSGAFQAIDVGRVGAPISYVVAIDEHGNVSEIVEIDTADRVPPATPNLDEFVLVERGRAFNDTVRGRRGAVGQGEEDLWLHAYNEPSLNSELPGFPILVPAGGFNSVPTPGSFPETSIGDNHADNSVNPPAVVGTAAVWFTAEDEFGNESQPARLPLDVAIPNPDPTKIYVVSQNPQTDAYIIGMNRAVEGHSRVLVSADLNAVLVFGNFYSDDNGAWDAVNIGPLLRQPDVISGAYLFPDRRDTVYVRSVDLAGNKSAIVPISVEIVTYAVLDAFGGVTMRNGLEGVADSLQPTFLPDGVARDLEPGFYRANGALDTGFVVGDPALPEFTASPTGFYRMTGTGQIAGLGDVLPVDQTGFTPFSGDYAKDIEVSPTQPGPKVGVYMLDGAGSIYTFGGADPLIGVALGGDLARDLELYYQPDGTVKGGYILDGRGGVSNLGAAPAIVPPPPFLPDEDVFIDIELVKNPSTLAVEGAFVLSKFGQIVTGGITDGDFVADTTRGVPFFGFNIARDLELSIDEVGAVIGLYVLDGFGGVHTGGQAPKIHDAPFFGFDVARDLEIVRPSPQQ